MFVQAECKGNEITGLQLDVREMLRSPQKQISAIELNLGDLRVRCQLQLAFPCSNAFCSQVFPKNCGASKAASPDRPEAGYEEVLFRADASVRPARRTPSCNGDAGR
jgi:hypothetical protein